MISVTYNTCRQYSVTSKLRGPFSQFHCSNISSVKTKHIIPETMHIVATNR